MASMMEGWSAWISSTALSKMILDSSWLFPAGEILHFIGLAMLFGFAAAIDLRMLGVGKRLPLDVLHRMLPWGMVGFAFTVFSGLLFLTAAPSQYLPNGVFWIKMLFVALAGLNVLYFYVSGIYQSVEHLGPGENAPSGAKVVAFTSLVLWIGVMFWGRMLAFLGIAF